MSDYIAQIIGFIGLFISIMSFQKNSNKEILFMQVLASLTFSTHYILLGAFTGAAMNILGATRNFVYYSRGRERKWAEKKCWPYIFIAGYILMGILTWKNVYSILPVIGTTLGSIGLWIKNPKYTRIVMFATVPFWLIYNVVNMSIAGILTEIFLGTSLIVAFIRFDIENRPVSSQD